MTNRIWPFRHFGLKLLSVGLAILLWMNVAGEETVERGLRAPLELQQFPAGLEIQGEPPSTVDVRVRGTSGALSRVGPGDIVGVLDLHAVRAGNKLFTMTPEQIRVPTGIEVVQVTPSTIALTFENSLSREIPVVPSIEGTPAPGYVVVGKPTVSPESLDIVGPETSVKRAIEAITETVSIADAHDSIRQEVSVGLVDPALRLKTQRTVTVSVKIAPGPLERSLRGLPVHIRNLGPQLSAQVVPSVVDVGLRGSREMLTRLGPDDVTTYVDVGGLGAGEYPMPVHADASSRAGVTHIEPATVQVRINSAKN
jgi:YbbR domain-containing protein